MSNTIPRDFIESLLAKIDIVDLIDNRVPLRKKTGSNFFACCPFHQEKNPSFSVSQTKQFYYCFGCGAHGNAIDFLMQYDRLSFPESVETLAKQMGLEIPRSLSKRPQEKKVSHEHLFSLMANIAKYYQAELKNSKIAVEYLKTRGVSGSIAKEFGIGIALPGWDRLLKEFNDTQALHDTGMIIKKDDGSFYDRFRERIMFPIHNRQGQIIGFGGRIINEGEPKYLNSPETIIFQKGQELYGLYHAQKANRQLAQVLIVEGYMDVIALHQHDITYAVATLGTATTANHLQRLFRYTSSIIFCFDGDTAGKTAAWRALQVTLPIMRDGIQIHFMFLPDNEDPDSLVRKEGKAAFEQRMQNTLTIADFFFQTIASQTDLSSTDGRARFVKLAMEHINPIPQTIFKQLLLEELAQKARIASEKLQGKMKKGFTPKKSMPPKAKAPSALRLVIALLLQHPQLASLITEPLPSVNSPGFVLLEKLIRVTKERPDLTTGALLEYWRDQPDEKLLAKFVLMEHVIPEHGIEQEFLGAMIQVRKLAHQEIIDSLLAKAALGGLSGEEKQLLQSLIRATTT